MGKAPELWRLPTHFCSLSSIAPLVRLEVENLAEGKVLELLQRVCGVLDPAAVVVDAVSASARDVEIHRTEARQLVAARVLGCGDENSTVELPIAATVALKRSGALADYQD